MIPSNRPTKDQLGCECHHQLCDNAWTVIGSLGLVEVGLHGAILRLPAVDQPSPLPQ